MIAEITFDKLGALAIYITFITIVAVGLIFVVCRLYNQYKLNNDKSDKSIENIKEEEKEMSETPYNICYEILELIVSNLCILSAAYIYYWLNIFFSPYKLWIQYSSFVILFLIIISVLSTNIIDKRLSLLSIPDNDKGLIRLMSSLCVLGILCFVNIKTRTDLYNNLILFYLSLVLGRFIYFDSSFNDIAEKILSIFSKIYIIILWGIYIIIICYIGFREDLLNTNNLIISLIIVHSIILWVIDKYFKSYFI